uniref:Uncharacterized protein n=1 Tax=Oncorhynchus tshawytscha TaxID=74940 RepID=A0A8C8JBK7_ONCTS
MPWRAVLVHQPSTIAALSFYHTTLQLSTTLFTTSPLTDSGLHRQWTAQTVDCTDSGLHRQWSAQTVDSTDSDRVSRWFFVLRIIFPYCLRLWDKLTCDGSGRLFIRWKAGHTVHSVLGLVLMTGAESVEWSQTHGFHGFQVFDAFPFAPFQPFIMSRPPLNSLLCYCFCSKHWTVLA